MNLTELSISKTILRKELEFYESIKGCKSCDHYQKSLCKLANAAPPDDVIESGCDWFVWDEIPF